MAKKALSTFSFQLEQRLLTARSGMSKRNEDFLRLLWNEGIRLFCALGANAKKWEEVPDWICVDQAPAEPHTMTTASHIDESLAEVIEIAQLFDTEEKAVVQVLER
ncbi:hypothetical protein [Herbaspirillum aquaticum]|jgi:hypothetical protein|uniref:hypothetical protein n=1 Tax=Herbaspirillum aquaticum TaxID=568783 RepID=UPI0024DE6572|nr:hypothetical protein [Herbaspirillum aquaticum]